MEEGLKHEIAMNVLLVCHNVSIYAVTGTVLLRAVVIPGINHRQKTGKDVRVSIFHLLKKSEGYDTIRYDTFNFVWTRHFHQPF